MQVKYKSKKVKDIFEDENKFNTTYKEQGLFKKVRKFIDHAEVSSDIGHLTRTLKGARIEKYKGKYWKGRIDDKWRVKFSVDNGEIASITIEKISPHNYNKF